MVQVRLGVKLPMGALGRLAVLATVSSEACPLGRTVGLVENVRGGLLK